MAVLRQTSTQPNITNTKIQVGKQLIPSLTSFKKKNQQTIKKHIHLSVPCFVFAVPFIPSFNILRGLFLCFTQFCGTCFFLNFDKFCDTAPL